MSRAQVVIGKFLGCWLACGLALVMFYLFLGLMSGAREHEWPVINYLQAMWLQWVFLAVVIALVLLGSIVFAAPSSNATISLVVVLGIWFLGRHLRQVGLQQAEPVRSVLDTIYFLIPHLEWFDVRDRRVNVHAKGLVPWVDCALATLYGAAYTALFLFATWLCFRRKALQT